MIDGTIDDIMATQGHGVRLIVEQGLLDHWFTPDHWGMIKPAQKAFDLAEKLGLAEKHFSGAKYRLTNLGRKYRAEHEIARRSAQP